QNLQESLELDPEGFISLWLGSSSGIDIGTIVILCLAQGPYPGRYYLNPPKDAILPFHIDRLWIHAQSMGRHLGVDLQGEIADTEHGPSIQKGFDAPNAGHGHIPFLGLIKRVAQ